MATHFQPFKQFAKPFAIGLKLLNEEPVANRSPAEPGLFQPDHKFEEYLTQKQRLFAQGVDNVFMAGADTVKAQNEVLNIVLKAIFTGKEQAANKATLTCPVSGTQYQRPEYDTCPLALASLLVQEDLVLMRRKPDGWTLVAASLCFPSSWKLAEKFGKPLTEIHKPVPGASKNLDPMIHRIFDNLKPEMPVWRENWSIYGDDKLRHSTGENARLEGGEHDKTDDTAYLRREYQTLHRLPESDDILFTIRILVEPLEIIEEQKDPAAIAATLLAQIAAMSAKEKEYKGFNKGLRQIELYLQSLSQR